MVNLLYRSGVEPIFAYGLTGPVSFAYLIASGVLSVPFGVLSDKYGRRVFTVIGCLAGGAGLIALPLTASLVGLYPILVTISAIFLLIGIGHASYTAGVLAYTGDISSEEDIGEAYGLVELAEFTSFSFAPALGGVLATLLGLSAAFLFSGATLMAAALIGYLGMKQATVRKMPLGMPDGEARPVIPNRFRLFLNALRNPGVLLALFATLLLALALQTFRNFVPLFGTNAGFSVFYLTIFVSIEAVASLGVSFPTGILLDRTGRRTPILIAGLIGSAVTLALVVLVPRVLIVGIWSAVFGVFVGITRVPPVVMITEGTVIENRAASMGASHAFEHAGYAVGAVAGGFLLSQLGFTNAFQDVMLILLAASAILAVLSVKKKIR
jgi:MFS family permease